MLRSHMKARTRAAAIVHAPCGWVGDPNLAAWTSSADELSRFQVQACAGMPALRPALRRLGEGAEQDHRDRVLGGPVFRVPLHAENKPARPGHADRLDHPV